MHRVTRQRCPLIHTICSRSRNNITKNTILASRPSLTHSSIRLLTSTTQRTSLRLPLLIPMAALDGCSVSSFHTSWTSTKRSDDSRSVPTDPPHRDTFPARRGWHEMHIFGKKSKSQCADQHEGNHNEIGHGNMVKKEAQVDTTDVHNARQ
jgi:hypothetical protein